jgi:hypothetical protein
MKHNLPTSTFRIELESLKQHNGRLQRLITNCTASGYPAQGKQPISPPRLSPDILRENTAHAEDLYHAICNSYNCQCPSPHEANLGLRQVSPKLLDDGEPFELIFQVEEENEDMARVDLKSHPSTYSSMASTEMASTEESYDTFSMEYDILPIIEDAVLTDHIVHRTGVGRQEAASETYRHYPPDYPSENRKTVHLLREIKEAARFRLAGATVARMMLGVSTTYAYSSKAWTIIQLSLLRLHA